MTDAKMERVLLIFIFAHLLFGMFLSYFNIDYFSSVYTREDGILEWLQFDFLLLGAVLSFYRAFVYRQRGWLFVFPFALFGLLFTFGAGEEISWGQRIFNVTSSEFFLNNNSQQEMNFHNLIISGVRINKLVFGLGLSILIAIYMLILPILYAKTAKMKQLMERFPLPLPRLVHILSFVALFIIAQLTASTKRGELLEFGGCAIFFLMIYLPKNRIK